MKYQEDHDVQDVNADVNSPLTPKGRQDLGLKTLADLRLQALRELGGDHPDYWEDRIVRLQRSSATATAPGVPLSYTGVAPDAPVTRNEDGGMQSQVEGRFDLIPPIAMFELAKVMEHGAQKYAPRNWYKIPLESHINHLLMHMNAYLAGNRDEDHLSHVLARAAMAVEIQKLKGDLDTTP